MNPIRIGNHLIGPGNPTFVIAEVGSNHGGNMNQAKRLIDIAADAGADAVKFQTYSARTLYSRYTPQFTYLEEQGHSKSTWDIIHDAELPREWQAPLADYAQLRGILFISTPTDRDGVDQLEAIGVPAYKISSYEAIDLPFVEYVARKGKPMIISTGMCSTQEIQDILNTCYNVGNRAVALLQCTSLYPAPYHLANLRAIPLMQEAHDVPVGLSDHTPGIHIPMASIALGSCIIEKHFTLNRTLPGPDHPHSLEPDELRAMIQQIRHVEVALGDGGKRGPAPEEQEMFVKARRSVVAAVDIMAGAVITADMVMSKRPGYGIPARDIVQVVGRIAQRDIREDEVIEWGMV